MNEDQKDGPKTRIEQPDTDQDHPTNEMGEARPANPSPSKSDSASRLGRDKSGTGSGSTSEETFPVDFSGFVLSLAQSVLIDLGIVPHPETGETEKNLRQACNTIDLLAMLQQKTRGNLTAEENALLDGTLYQLRLSFVEAKSRNSP